MKNVFLTGATGFIGSKLVKILLERGYGVRGLSRQSNPAAFSVFENGNAGDNFRDHPNFEPVPGDITDPDSLLRGMNGCDYVLHLAAYAKNWSPDPTIFAKMNIEGTRNVFEAARQCGVRRIVWTSSIVTLGPTRRGTVGDETMPRITERYLTEYEETKSLAEKEALQWVEKGLPLVIVNPTRVYGPGKMTEGNSVVQLIKEYTRGRAPFLPNFGLNIGNYAFVDDVAQGHFLALEKGRIGERYILGGENISLLKFLWLIDEISGRRHLKIPMFRFWPFVIGQFQKYRAEWFGVYPQITPGWVRTFMTDWTFSSEKAKTELGYDPIPLREGLSITWDWLRQSRDGL